MTTQLQKPRTCNPRVINLSKLAPDRIARGAAAHEAEGLAQPELVDRPGEQRFFFKQAAGPNNGHAGIDYTVYIGRENPKSPVEGWCTCASGQLCKHVCKCYLVAKELILRSLREQFGLPIFENKFCVCCAAEFQTSVDGIYCFNCTTDPAGPVAQMIDKEKGEAALDRDYEDLFGCPRPRQAV